MEQVLLCKKKNKNPDAHGFVRDKSLRSEN